MGKKAGLTVKNKEKVKEDSVSEVERLNSTSDEKKSRRVQKIETAIEAMELTTGVLYVSHLPWGANESMLKKYFEQFGKISRLNLPRSKETGRIKGYAFIEFESLEVAAIAAKTMNNFILFERILKCEVITDRARYNNIFKTCKKQFKFFNKYKKFVQERNKKKSQTELKENVEAYLSREAEKREKLKSQGINYSFPGYAACVAKK